MDQGLPAYPSTNYYAYQDYATDYVNKQEAFLNYQHAGDVCKQFILDNMKPVYLSSLKDHKVGFKNISLNQMVNHLINKYSVSKEAEGKQKQILQEPWNPNKNIKHLYKHTKNTNVLVGITYHQSDFIYYVYMVINNSQQMKKAYKRWSNKTAFAHAIEQQCRDHFSEYNEMDNEDEQLQNGSITNNVVLQTTQDALQEVKQQLKQAYATNAVFNAHVTNMETQAAQQHKENELVISRIKSNGYNEFDKRE